MEADFIEYYRIDIRDLWLDDNLVTCRLVSDLMCELPDNSRFMKAVREDDFDLNQHLQADVIDILTAILYQNSIVAAAKAQKQYKKIMSKAPKPMKRPGAPVVVEKKQFTRPEDLNGFLTQGYHAS